MEITIQNERKFRLNAALLFYRAESNYGANTKSAAVLHPVREDGSLAPGRALDLAALEYYFKNSDNADRMRFIDSKVLARSYDSIVWIERSRIHPIYFEINPAQEPKRKILNKLSGRKAYWPNLLFKYANGSLYCRALKSNRRPTLKTPLYVAPLTHISEETGQVCIPEGIRYDKQFSLEVNMENISENFFMGKFGHVTGSMRQINHPGGHDGFWIEYLKRRKARPFPSELLVKTNQTLEDFLK